jgi:diacylglycerol kinase family enzyme
MRARLATGTHVPHPDIAEAAGASIEVSTARRWPVQVDGRPVSARSGLTATVRSGAWRLLV